MCFEGKKRKRKIKKMKINALSTITGKADMLSGIIEKER
jgi:hypothetical protein